MRSAGSTAETTPRTVEPAGINTLPFCIRSATVVASKRCSTFAVFEGALDVGGTYTGALVPPEVPLVVAPHATVPRMLARATIRITADIGPLPPASIDRRAVPTRRSNAGAQGL